MPHLVFLDTETTSLDDTRGEVWEIAAIVRRDGHDDVEYLWQIRPNLSTADPMSLRISRYYERRVLGIHAPGEAVALIDPDEDSRRFTGAAAVANKLAQLLEGAHVVGAVPDFDFRFLRRFLARYGECWTAHYHLINVEALAVGYLYGVVAGHHDYATDGPDGTRQPEGSEFHPANSLPSLPWKSLDLYRAVGVDPARHEEHTALGDARLVRAVYDAITGGA
ncbi:hypothetical protein [Thermoactinospora rubra]|uniref:3'-5' exonuclease n=1 Tax=Thermoactinospora rubra TaxID=1088767 RepID=UPI000A1114E1|nr:hypothetical protein [Thermoactinospora rubra]